MNKKEKHKQKKKIERRKRVKYKLMKIREQTRIERKVAMDEEKARIATEELVNGKKKPIINDLNKIVKENEIKKQEVKEQLENNLKILQALEDEYDAENKNRTELNKKLESEGHFTLKEKLDALHKTNMKKHDCEEQEKPSKSS